MHVPQMSGKFHIYFWLISCALKLFDRRIFMQENLKLPSYN